MPKRDSLNVTSYWMDPSRQGISLLRADFTKHVFPPHFHEELIVAGTVMGTGEFISQGKSHITGPGCVVVFNPYEPHEGRVVDGQRWRYRSIYIATGELTAQLRKLSEGAVRNPYFSNNNIVDPELAGSLLRMHLALESSGDLMERETLLLDFLARLIRRHAHGNLEMPSVGSDEKRLQNALDYLHSSFSENISVAELAALACFSEYHFIRSFRKRFGVSPHGYLTQIRLDEARQLLRRGKPLAETALAVGFCDQSHLDRRFKRVYGITPGQFVRASAGAALGRRHSNRIGTATIRA